MSRNLLNSSNGATQNKKNHYKIALVQLKEENLVTTTTQRLPTGGPTTVLTHTNARHTIVNSTTVHPRPLRISLTLISVLITNTNKLMTATLKIFQRTQRYLSVKIQFKEQRLRPRLTTYRLPSSPRSVCDVEYLRKSTFSEAKWRLELPSRGGSHSFDEIVYNEATNSLHCVTSRPFGLYSLFNLHSPSEYGEDLKQFPGSKMNFMTQSWTDLEDFGSFENRYRKLQVTTVGLYPAVYFPFYHALVYFSDELKSANVITLPYLLTSRYSFNDVLWRRNEKQQEMSCFQSQHEIFYYQLFILKQTAYNIVRWFNKMLYKLYISYIEYIINQCIIQ